MTENRIRDQHPKTNSKPMEETEDADVQARFTIDLCRAEEFCHADASSCDLREPIREIREILETIENVCKTCSSLWVNRQQCTQMADSFSAVGAALKGLKWNRNNSLISDGGDDKKYPELDKLLTVLRKGEILVSSYNSWSGRFFGSIGNRDTMFKEVHEELEIMKEQFLFEELDFASTLKSANPKKMDMMNLDVIRQVLDKTHNLVVEEVIEKADSVEEMVADIWQVEKITGKDMDVMKGLDITEQAQDLIGERIYLGEVCKLTWKGVPYTLKVFGVVDFGVLDMALQTGNNTIYLHPNGAFHTDLESLNILVDKHLMESLKLLVLDSTICRGANLEDACSCGIPCTEVLPESCETASKSVEDDEALKTRSADSSSINVVPGSCAPEAQKSVSGCHDGEPARKRNCKRIWIDDEKLALLELTEEAPRLDAGRVDWEYVSDTLWEEDDFDRAAISCQMQWDTLLQCYRAPQDHESNSTPEFDSKCREIIDRILAANPLEDTRIFQIMDADLASSAASLCAIYMDHFNCDEALDDESTDDESEEFVVQSEDEGVSVDSTAVDNQDETSSGLYMRDGLQIETGSGEDEVIGRIAPFVNKQMEDALKPLICVFQRWEETEQKHRAELLAIEEEKLSLKRQKIQLRRRAGLANSMELVSPWVQKID